MDQRIVIYMRDVIFIVSLHRLQGYHLHENHSQTKNIGFRRDVGIVVEVLQFLVLTIGYF